MADINHAYGNIFDNDIKNVRKISHFFTQRKLTESHDSVNPKTLKRIKKDFNYTQNYLALVLPKDENSPKLRIEIYGNNGYCYQGEIVSFTENNPHLLIPLNDDKEIFVNIFDYAEESKEKQIKYISFIHVPKRYQMIDDDSSTRVNELKNNQNNNQVKTQKLNVNL